MAIEPCTSITSREPARWCRPSTFCVITASSETRALERGERQVAGVRLRVGEHAEAPAVELPDLRRVAPEAVDRRDLVRVVLRPDAGRRCGSPGCPLSVDTPAPVSATHGWFAAISSASISRLVHGFSFSTAIRVRFAETDAQGIAHNSNYFVWFEVARVEYLEQFAGGYQRLRDLGVEALVLESHVRYLAAGEVRRPAASSTRAASTCAARGSATSTRSSGRAS